MVRLWKLLLQIFGIGKVLQSGLTKTLFYGTTLTFPCGAFYYPVLVTIFYCIFRILQNTGFHFHLTYLEKDFCIFINQNLPLNAVQLFLLRILLIWQTLAKLIKAKSSTCWRYLMLIITSSYCFLLCLLCKNGTREWEHF